MASTKVPIELSSTPGIVDNSNATAITIDSSENVGIGTSIIPSGVRTKIKGLAEATSLATSATSAALFIEPYSGSSWGLGIGSISGQIQYIQGVAAAGDSARELSLQPYGGNVGIGTSSPAGNGNLNVHAHSTSTITSLKLSNSTSGAGSSQGFDLISNANTAYVWNRQNDSMIFGTNNLERMRIDNSGRVGIFNSSAVNYSGAGARSLVVGSNSSASDPHGITIVGGSSSTSNLAFTDNAGDGSANDYRGLFQYFHPDDSLRVFVASTERMRITSNGEFLLNRTSIFGTGNTCSAFIEGKSTAAMYVIGTNTSGYQLITFFNGSLNVMGSITHNNTSVTYGTSSDYRLKENVVELDGAIDRVKLLQPKRFNFIADAENTVDGFLAHEVADVVPEAITGVKDEVDEDGNAVYQNIDQSKLVPLLTKAIQEQQVLIEQLQAEVALLKGE